MALISKRHSEKDVYVPHGQCASNCNNDSLFKVIDKHAKRRQEQVVLKVGVDQVALVHFGQELERLQVTTRPHVALYY